MKTLYFVLFITLFSCSKSIEDNCFVDKINSSEYITVDEKLKPYSIEQIIEGKPNYLEIINLKNYRGFKKDSIESYSYDQDLNDKRKMAEENLNALSEKFSHQFWCFAKQQVGNVLYGLGKNNLGYWMLKIENDKPKAYFLGLGFNQYYCNQIQERPIIKDEYLQIEGSLVKPIEIGGLPGYTAYSALEDGKLFKIKLKDLILDADGDGYNDLFEESFGLNPDQKDTDRDGINDFDDLNPMFKSEKNKFTQLYELLLPIYLEVENFKTRHYFFQVYESDCDYFHQINPEIRVLFIPEKKDLKTYYTRITDVTDENISKIQKNPKNPENFYIYKSGSGFKNDYSADYENGKWKLKVVGGYII